MHNLLNANNPFLVWIGRIFDYLILGFLWIVCSIPIITIGAATTAANYASLKLLIRDDDSIIKNFFLSFRQNFKQATIVWIGVIIVAAFLILDIRLCFNYSDISPTFISISMILLIVFSLIAALILFYVFPILSWFENTIFRTVQTAAVLSLHHWFSCVLIIALDASLIAIALQFVSALLILPGALLLIHGFYFRKIFLKYLPSDDEAS